MPLSDSDSMLMTCAKVVQFVLVNNFNTEEKKLIAKMLVEGFRKAHDKADVGLGMDKFKGHLFWSDAALATLAEKRTHNERVSIGLRHEHAVPLLFLVEEILFTLPRNSSLEGIYSEIKEYGKVVIITRDEDKMLKPSKTMPEGWSENNKNGVFARYKNDDGSNRFAFSKRCTNELEDYFKST